MGGSAKERDWVFIAFCTLAAGTFAWTGIEAYLIDRAAKGAWQCIADADAACVDVELERAKAIAPKDPRTLVIAAATRVLRKELAPAEEELLPLSGRDALDASVRANILLLEGDVAAIRFRIPLAREKYAAGRQLLDDGRLVDPRVARLAKGEEESAANVGGTVARLQSVFDALFDAATEGQADIVTIRSSEVGILLSRVLDPGLRQQLQIGVQTAHRVLAANPRHPVSLYPGYFNGGVYLAERPVEPTRDSSPASNAGNQRYADLAYQRAMSDYQKRLATWQKSQDETEKRNADIDERNAVTTSEGRRVVQDALAKLAAHPELVSQVTAGP